MAKRKPAPAADPTPPAPAPAAAPESPAPQGRNYGFAAEQLKSFVQRIERMEEEKRTIQDDIKDIYAEAKGTGFDVKILRQVIRIRQQDKAEREEQEAVLDLYMQALGMSFADTPLGRAAAEDAA